MVLSFFLLVVLPLAFLAIASLAAFFAPRPGEDLVFVKFVIFI